LVRAFPYLVGLLVLAGGGLLIVGAAWGALLVVLGLGGFVVAAWAEARPRGIRVSDPDPIWFGHRIKIEPPGRRHDVS